MDISFSDDTLFDLCNRHRSAVRRFGVESAKKLSARLADIQAAARLSEVVAGKPHPLKVDRREQFSLRLHGGARLVLEADGAVVPRGVTGDIDWPNVTAVRVVYIGDYHD